MAKTQAEDSLSDLSELRRRCRRFALFQMVILGAAVFTGIGGFALVAASGAVLGAVFALWAGLACVGPLIEAAVEYDMIPAAFRPIRKTEYERLWARAVRHPELRAEVERILEARNTITRYEYARLMGDASATPGGPLPVP
ncbi:MAG TPA: hypothetical protein VKA55_08645 [Gammaproteobacteria bacterium]|nr:hypothetical protein [Gammaproteobacteria bacterium]